MVLHYQVVQGQTGLLLLHQNIGKTSNIFQSNSFLQRIPIKKNKEVRKIPDYTKESETEITLSPKEGEEKYDIKTVEDANDDKSKINSGDCDKDDADNTEHQSDGKYDTSSEEESNGNLNKNRHGESVDSLAKLHFNSETET